MTVISSVQPESQTQWNKESQSQQWSVFLPPTLHSPHSAVRSVPASCTPYHPMHQKTQKGRRVLLYYRVHLVWVSRLCCLKTDREWLDIPLHRTLFRHPLGAACGGLELGWVGITGHWYQNGYVVGCGPSLEVTASLREMTRGWTDIWHHYIETHVHFQMHNEGGRYDCSLLFEFCVVVSNRWQAQQ